MTKKKPQTKALYKTTIVIWSKEDPTEKYELESIARQATNGKLYCSIMYAKKISNPKKDPDWFDGSDFFDEQI